MGWTRYFRRRHWDEERARELDAYVAIETDENIARGMSPEDARLAARRKLGNRTRVLEDIHAMNTIAPLDTLAQDLRYAWRILRMNPGFAIVAVLSLALGIGANTAMFQLVNAVRLRTLPIADPGTLVDLQLDPTSRAGSFNGRFPRFTYPLYETIRDRQTTFSALAAWSTRRFNLVTGGEARYAQGLLVSGNFFDVLGLRPHAGRLLTAADDSRGCGASPVVVSHAFWQRELGGRPSAIGRPLTVDGRTFEVVGVTPPGFFGVEVGRRFDLALPLCARALVAGNDEPNVDRRDFWWLALLGRLSPHRTLDDANAQLRAISRGVMEATRPPTYRAELAQLYLKYTLTGREAGTGLSGLRQRFGDPLVLLLATTGFVLLIACANLANLLLARASARQQEMAVRLAIGASRRRLVRQLFVESLLLALLGAALGLFVARILTDGLVAALSTSQSPVFVDLRLDWRVAGFTAVLALATGLLFGIAPALKATRTAPSVAIRADGRGLSTSRERFALRRSLVVVQIALSLVLLLGALLFVRTLYNLVHAETGFSTDGVIVASLDLRRLDAAPERLRLVHQSVLDRIRALPGVEGADQAAIVPMGGDFWNQKLRVTGNGTESDPAVVNFTRVGPAYFHTLRIPLVAGRNFAAQDGPESTPVALVNAAFVREHVRRGSPIGLRVRVEAEIGKREAVYEIVGVVGDTKHGDLRETFGPMVYLPASQEANPGRGMSVVVRSTLPPNRVIPALVRAVGDEHPAIGVEVQVMTRQLRETLTRERLMALLSGGFGVLATFMATLGLYGVMSYIVTRRRHEIGIRLALGAERRDVLRMMIGDTSRLLVAGIACGTALALAAGSTARALLFGLDPGDPTTIALAIVALSAAVFVAGYLPAARASRLDPVTALRQE
jgi:putative ABC transport system permease protein